LSERGGELLGAPARILDTRMPPERDSGRALLYQTVVDRTYVLLMCALDRPAEERDPAAFGRVVHACEIVARTLRFAHP
jgi:hypothetical protein